MIPTVTPPRTHSPAPHAGSPKRAGSEAPSLTVFLDALAPENDEGLAPAGERQGDAPAGKEDGKLLPEQPAPSPFAWLATLTQPVVTPPPSTPAAAATVTQPVIGTASAAGPPAPLTTDAAGPAQPTPQPDQPLSSPPLLDRLARDPALAAMHGPVTIELPATAARRDAAAPIAAASFMPTSAALVTPGTTAPAGQIFAAALHAADREKQPEVASKDAALPSIQAFADVGAPVVQAAGNTDAGGTLDMTDHRWPHAMMDRIERLRDDANANDTRIRLSPDNLGAIDVAVRRDGDTLHVHFHAAEAETRSLLADAQPQLAQLATERGLRLGDAQVGGGSAGQQQARSPARPTPASPHPAAAVTGEGIPTDIRVA